MFCFVVTKHLVKKIPVYFPTSLVLLAFLEKMKGRTSLSYDFIQYQHRHILCMVLCNLIFRNGLNLYCSDLLRQFPMDLHHLWGGPFAEEKQDEAYEPECSHA